MRGLKRVLAIAAMLCVASATTSAQVKLEFKFPENQEYRFEEKVRVEHVQAVGGQEQRMTTEQTVVLRVEVGAMRADGNVPVTQTIESMKTQTDFSNGRSIVVDTNDDSPPPADFARLKRMRDELKMFVGASFVVVMDSAGNVAAIEGTENAVKNAEELKPGLVAAIRQRFDNDRLKKASKEQYGILPDSLVRPGDSWVRTQTVTVGTEPLAFERKYEYVGKEERDGRTLDRISVKSTSVRRAPGAGDNEIDTLLTLDLKVDSSDGTILFDRELGRIVESTTTTRIVGDQKVLFQGKSSVSKVDQTITTGYALLPAKVVP